ncbi:MAG: glycosyltransferase family 4 protein [Planctomycetota bacterium]
MKLAIFSNMEGCGWGASEELWRHAALRLLGEGHQVFVNCKKWKHEPHQLVELRQRGAVIHRRGKPEKVLRDLKRSLKQKGLFRSWLRKARPDLVLLNASVHTGDVAVADDCRAMGLPYAMLLHSLPPTEWYRERDLPTFKDAYGAARAAYFVSESLREMLEERIAQRCRHAAVVANPMPVACSPLPWPDESEGLRLACPARYDPGVKGHDLILRVLRDPKWRRRRLRVSFFGEANHHTSQLKRLAAMYRVEQSTDFVDVYTNVNDIWRTHHGLLLPSRHEGVPMTTVEALMCGRTAVVTDVGRNAEFVDHGETGFLVPAATSSLLDAALDEAWQRQAEWRAMGVLGAERVARRFPEDPVGDFCRELTSCLEPSTPFANQADNRSAAA